MFGGRHPCGHARSTLERKALAVGLEAFHHPCGEPRPADPETIQEQLPGRNVKRFRGGLVFEAHRLAYHSTLGLRVIEMKKKNTFRSSDLQRLDVEAGVTKGSIIKVSSFIINVITNVRFTRAP